MVATPDNIIAAGKEEPHTGTQFLTEEIMGDNSTTTDEYQQQIKTNIADDSSDKTESHISNDVHCDDAKEDESDDAESFDSFLHSGLDEDIIICNNTNNCKDGEDEPPTAQLMETNTEERDTPIVYDDNRSPVKGPADSTSVECSESAKKLINDTPSDDGASDMSNNIDGEENNQMTVDELTLDGTNASTDAYDGNDVPATTELDSHANDACNEVDQQQTNYDDDATAANNSDQQHKNNGNTKNEGVVNTEEKDRLTEVDVKQNDKCNGADDEYDDFVPIEIDNPIQSADSIDANFVLPSPSTVTSQPTIPRDNNTINSNNALPPPPTRRKILRHPILTPLTKLPWDRFISAAGACDALFNCKYSMKQVEDEVREEHTRTIGGHYLENGGNQEDMVGREDGYVNLSLGNEYGDYHYGDEGCDADEFAELGLGCCSMLDSEADEEVEVVAHVNSLEEEGEDQCQPPCNNEDEQEGKWEEVNVKKEGKDQTSSGQPSTSTLPLPDSSLLSNQQKADASWKSSNPSLDMMVYRTMMQG